MHLLPLFIKLKTSFVFILNYFQYYFYEINYSLMVHSNFMVIILQANKVIIIFKIKFIIIIIHYY